MKRKKPSKGSGSPSFANPEIGQIEQLLRFMSEHNLEEFEYSRGDLRIRLKKPGTTMVMAAPVPRPAPEIIVPSALSSVTPEIPKSAGKCFGYSRRMGNPSNMGSRFLASDQAVSGKRPSRSCFKRFS